MDTADLDYDLPVDAIAQHPAEPRDGARLLVDRGAGVDPDHRTVAELDELLAPGDILVVNDTRVIPARLHLQKPTGGAVEVVLLDRDRSLDGGWEALVRPGRRVPPGTLLRPARALEGDHREGSDVAVEVGEVLGDGRRHVTLHSPDNDDLAVLDEFGELPLPPYIHEPLVDPERYQTVFATRPGSVAAPTAGLHLTTDLLRRCEAKGVTIASVELAVGLGTFRPITTDRVEDHPLHAERYRVPAATAALLAGRPAPSRGKGAGSAGSAGPPGSVVAVGTTVVRTLETWAATGETSGTSGLFIHGSYPFAMVDRLITNFHVPRSSLLALVEAFVGPRWRDLYATALAERYRFLSFGDAMTLHRAPAR